jgi:transposase
MEDPQGKRRRKQKQRIVICDSVQMDLFEREAAGAASVRWRDHRVFKERDPRGIRFGGLWLDEYLEKAGIKEPFVVRGLLEKQDWQAFEGRYGVGGCAAYAPLAMTGLILYGVMQGVETLRGLERLARTDVGCMWVTGGITPDHATIGRFIVQHGDLLGGEFFESLTQAVLRKTGSGTGRVAGDGTVIQAVASRYTTIKREAAELLAKQACERAADSGDTDKHADAQGVLETLEGRIEARKQKMSAEAAEQVKISLNEPEAVVQPLKEGGYAPSYKPSVLVNEGRVVVAYAVDPSNETVVIPGMVAMAERIGREKIRELLLDSGYFDHGVLSESIERDIDLLCPEGKGRGDGSWEKTTKYYSKSVFVYDEERDVYTCPRGHEMNPVERCRGTEKRVGYVRYGTPACAVCAYRSECTQSAEGRKIKRYEGDTAKDVLREVMKDPRARARYRKRQGMVEPVFGYLKRVLKLTRFRRRGLLKVRVEFGLYVLAYNLCRAVAWVKKRAESLFFIFIAFILSSIGRLRKKIVNVFGFDSALPPRNMIAVT